uniref:Ethyl tert-butyl ether degradation EthD n=1 Tax=Rhodopseudomonas palustris (strain BisA53) TaxID=316055 RepID=Q07SY5_RHOP5
MILVTVMYPAGAESTFDLDYYLHTHIPMLKQFWTPLGMSGVQVLRGIGKPDGIAPDYQMMALLTFDSLDAFKAAGKAHGREIFADIPKFTNAQPSLQINDILQ